MTVKTPCKRINITLPQKTLDLLNRVAPAEQKSFVISQALEFYVEHRGKELLRQQIIEGAQVRAERDLALAEEWFELEDEVAN